MTEPQPELPFPGFQPSGGYALSEQRQEIVRLRAERDKAEDSASFYRACLAQHMTESQEQIASLAAQLSEALSDVTARDEALAFNPPSTWAEGDTSDDGVDAELLVIDPADRLIDASLVPGS